MDFKDLPFDLPLELFDEFNEDIMQELVPDKFVEPITNLLGDFAHYNDQQRANDFKAGEMLKDVMRSIALLRQRCVDEWEEIQ